jgi:predicted Fe-Mo cluster-binding NifX family protein
VVCAGMGVRAVQKLKEMGIRVYKVSGDTVEEIIEEYQTAELEEITSKNACSQHRCH